MLSVGKENQTIDCEGIFLAGEAVCEGGENVHIVRCQKVPFPSCEKVPILICEKGFLFHVVLIFFVSDPYSKL